MNATGSNFRSQPLDELLELGVFVDILEVVQAEQVALAVEHQEQVIE